MGSGTLLLLLGLMVIVAQPGDSTRNLPPGALAGEWSENGWSTRVRFLVPQQGFWSRVKTEKTFDIFSGRYLLSHGFAVPLTSEAGTYLIALQARERAVPEDPFAVATLDRTRMLDQGSVRVAVRWLDQRQDEIEASVSWRYGVAPPEQPVTTLGLSLKTALPTPVLHWYLHSGVQADSEQVRQASLSLLASHQAACGSSVTANFGITTREYRTNSRQLPGNYVLNSSVHWNRDDRLRVGVLFNYYLDVHEVSAVVFVELSLPARPR